MKRWIVGFIFIASLLLCVTTILFRFRGRTHWDGVLIHLTSHHSLVMISTSGELFLSIESHDPMMSMQKQIQFASTTPREFPLMNFDFQAVAESSNPNEPETPPWGFARRHEQAWIGFASPGTQMDSYSIIFPHWFALLVSAIPAIAIIIFWKSRRRRMSKGLCANCGYDLRASPSRCPECGQANSLVAKA